MSKKDECGSPVHHHQQFFSGLYHSIFPPKSPPSSSTLIAPSLWSVNNRNATARDTIAIEHRLNQARLVLAYQRQRDLRHAHPNDFIKEIDSIRRKNARLRLAELVKLLNLPSQGTLRSPTTFASNSQSSGPGIKRRMPRAPPPLPATSSTPLIQKLAANFIALYHSIFPPKLPPLLIAPSLASSASSDNSQTPAEGEFERVYRRRKLEQDALHIEPYMQALFRIYLCSNWWETGKCPYGEHCPSAHGIAELHKVISSFNPTRSSGYVELNEPAASRLSQVVIEVRCDPAKVRRMYVPGGKKEREALEFERYTQTELKTELCYKWLVTGTCLYGEHCQFSHGIAELRPLIGDGLPLYEDKHVNVPGGKKERKHKQRKFKTEICNRWEMTRRCLYGKRCQFAHGTAELEHPFYKSMVQQRIWKKAWKLEQLALENEVHEHMVCRTDLCSMFLETGACPYNDDCLFAHGVADLCLVSGVR